MSIDGRELGWDDVIENDGSEFVLLPEGDYDFEVVELERARHPGSQKLPPCAKAVVSIKLFGREGNAVIKHNLFLHTSTEGMLCAFFTGIGQRKKGEPFKMMWQNVVGSRGRAKVGIRKWTGNDGKELQSNEIKKFYEPEDKPGFEAGRF